MFLVNDGDMALEPAMVLNALGRSLKEHFRSVNGVVFFTVNETANVPYYHPAARLWMQLDVDNRPPVDGAFLDRIRAAWFSHLASIMGEPVGAISFAGRNGVGVDNVKMSNSKTMRLQL